MFGRERRTIIRDNEADTVEGSHSGIANFQHIFDAPKPVTVGTGGGGLWHLKHDHIVVHKKAKGSVAIGAASLRVHDPRHTFAYLAAQAGADLGDLQQLMGHAGLSMTLRYRGFMPNRSRDVIANLRGRSHGRGLPSGHTERRISRTARN